MTDNTQPEALDLADWLEAVGGGPSAKRCATLLREQHARIADLEAQLEAIGAGGVSGPLMGQPQAMPDLSALTERGAKAWAGVDAQGLREGFTAADMATASAQGFRDGVASLSAAEPANGLVTVPEVPTNAMTSAGANAVEDPENERSSWDLAENVWRAMVEAATTLTQGAAIAAGSPVVKESLTTDSAAWAVYAELPDDVIDYVKGSYAFLQSTAPDGYAEEVFRLPPSATRNQRSLQDALQSDKRGWHPAAARQDSGDGKRSGPDAGVSASHGQAQAASSEVLKAIREANMQLVRTGVDAFMLVPYKVATAQAAESVLEDAARYRWLRERSSTMFVNISINGDGAEIAATLDSAVDAARKQGANHE